MNITSPKNWRHQNFKTRGSVSKKYKLTSGITRYKKNNRPHKNKLINKLIHSMIVLFVLACISLLGLYVWVAREIPDRDSINEQFQPTSTKIYDRSEQILLYEIFTKEKRTLIKLEDLPDYTKWATIVAEDRNFYSHTGFSLKGIIRSMFRNITTGSRVGGSSITQQLIKNAWLTPEKTYTRKIKELLMSFQIEQKFSKDEILEMYLNEIPYGSTAYGIEAASQLYFSKSSQELTLAESAILASIPRATTYYSPYGSHKDALFSSQQYILNSMDEEGYISHTQAEEAKQQKIEFNPPESSMIAPHFILHIKKLLIDKYGPKTVEQGGLKVITTLDFEKQQIAENAIKQGVEKNEQNYGAHNAALLSMNPNTGEVLAMVGSRDYFNEEYDGAVNVVFSSRQPGSSFKPIVYATLFQKEGFTPETILFDTLTIFKTDSKDYEPHNYNDQTFGPVSIRKALAGSLNIPAVKAIYLAGINNVLNLADQLGYTTLKDRSRFGLSLVLGGGEIKLIEHLRAFSVFASYGKLRQEKYILKVTDKNNKILEENKPEKDRGKKVLDEQICKTINNILSDNSARAYIFGEQNHLTLPNHPIAAKTGTTNDFRDGWTIGYTPSLITGVWVGNNDNQPMKGNADGSNVAAPIWNQYMSQVLKDTETEEFEKPDDYKLPNKPMLNGNLAQEITVKIDKTTGKLATEFTPSSQTEEKVFKEVHNILHYIDKENPTGPIPGSPWNLDSNYTNWELAVEKWAQEEGFATGTPPTEYDDLHTNQNQPQLEIISPTPNQTIDQPQLTVHIKTSALRGVQKVEYQINNQIISTRTDAPFDLINHPLTGFSNEEVVLRVTSFDDVGNRTSRETKIKFILPAEYSQPATFLNPKPGDDIWEEMFPYNIELIISNPQLWNKVDFYIKNKHTDQSNWLGFSNINSTININYLWLTPPSQKDDYTIYCLTSNSNGRSIQSPEINIHIK